MRILVTGATGFIGSQVMRVLLQNRQEVAALVLPDDPRRSEFSRTVRVFPGTLNDAPIDELSDWHPEVCIHCAWVAAAGTYMESPLNHNFLVWSREFVQCLLEAGLRRFVGVGSCVERLGDEGDEDSLPPYVQCKRELCRFMLDSPLCPESVWARIHYAYGVGEDRKRFISSMINDFSHGRSFTVRCPEVRKDYIHVSDVATALARLATGTVQGCVDVGTGVGVPLGVIADTTAGLMNSGHLLAKGREKDPVGDVIAAPDALRRLGWAPRVELSEGIAAMVCHVQGLLE